MHLYQHNLRRRAALIGLLFATCAAWAVAATTFEDANGTWTITTNGNSINIQFAPKPAANCHKIIFVQTFKLSFDGTVYNPADIFKGWEYRRNDWVTTGAGAGWGVDHLFCEKDPGYNGDDAGQDSGTQGNSAPATTATMDDSPYMPDGYFPAGKTHCLMEFETCAMCADNANPSNWVCLGCIKWKYERTKGAAGKGTATLISTAVEAQSAASTAALSKFQDNHRTGGAQVCPEELGAAQCTNRVNGKNGPLLFHVNTDYDVKKAGAGVRKGRTPPDSGAPNDPIGATLTTCDYVYVPQGDQIEIKRTGGGHGPADGVTTYDATVIDLIDGLAETMQGGACLAAQNCGVRTSDCSNQPFFGYIAPLDSGDPLAITIHQVMVNRAGGYVLVRNDPLSAGPIQAVDVFGGGIPTTVAPGELTTLPLYSTGGPCFPDAGGCCTSDGGCHVSPIDPCLQSGGNFAGFGHFCQGDQNGNGIDDACETAPTICRGDCDCDGHVGFSDIDYFVQSIPDNLSGWQALYVARHGGNPPPCSFANCDMTGDGHVGFADIDPFVVLIPSSCP